MEICLTGGKGFVGTMLSRRLLDEGHDVTAIDLAPEGPDDAKDNYRYLAADTTREGAWQNAVSQSRIIINLAGASIFSRWTQAYKEKIYDSRILTTQNLVRALDNGRDQVLISTSAGGYYGPRNDTKLTESELPGNDFLARVCVDWEREAKKAEEKKSRVVITRFGVVFGQNGGALKQMVPAYKLCLGGPLGRGTQWFSWIHEEDLANAFLFAMEKSELTGPVNFTAPEPVRNQDLAKALGRVLRRPAVLRAPAFAIRLMLGEFGSSILEGQRVVPSRLLDLGFSFKFPEIETALTHLLD